MLFPLSQIRAGRMMNDLGFRGQRAVKHMIHAVHIDDTSSRSHNPCGVLFKVNQIVAFQQSPAGIRVRSLIARRPAFQIKRLESAVIVKRNNVTAARHGAGFVKNVHVCDSFQRAAFLNFSGRETAAESLRTLRRF